jgi:hypothetical protein
MGTPYPLSVKLVLWEPSYPFNHYFRIILLFCYITYTPEKMLLNNTIQLPKKKFCCLSWR